jgi:eukaryotic-like serine/threonine-protein kinase
MSTSNPFGDNPFDPSAATHSPAAGAPPPTTAGPGEVNTLATLSVVFAFVFAPAGAILGHLGLSQIARTRQRGRDRALVGLTLSYVIITAAVVALAVWASMGHTDSRPATAAPTTSAGRPAPPSAPPPPTVAPADVAALLPNLQQTKDLTANQSLKEGPIAQNMGPSTMTADPAACISIVSSGAAQAYHQDAVRGYAESTFLNVDQLATGLVVGMVVVSFDNATAARAQMDDLLAQWKRCVAGPATLHNPDGRTFTAHFTPLADAGDGITTVSSGMKESIATTVHALAVKANVVADIFLESSPAPTDQTRAVIKSILAKIPG